MYLAVARLSLQRQLSYRAANLAGLITNIFFGVLRAYVLMALFGARDSAAGYSVRDAVTFTGLTQALMSFIMIYFWWDLLRSVRTGEVGADLARPLDFYWYWAAQDAGRAVGHLALRGLPIMAVYAVMFDISRPPTAWHWLALAPAMLLGLWISFSWRFMVSLVAFWTRDAMGVGRLAWTLSMFLSGFLMPLAFFPEWLAAAMRLTPFPYMIYTIVEIYLGTLPAEGLPAALALQAAWGLGLYGLARVALAAGVRRLVIQGG